MRNPQAWIKIMNAYETGHYYAFKEKIFWVSTFINLVFIIGAIVAYVQLSESAEAEVLFMLIGAVLTILAMLFSCFVKWKYIQYYDEEDGDDTEMGTR